jgi:uncharacterized protein
MRDDPDPPSDEFDDPPPPPSPSRPYPQPNIWWSLLACVGLVVVQTVALVGVWLSVWLGWCALGGDMKDAVDQDMRNLQAVASAAGGDTPVMSERLGVSLTVGLVGAFVAMFVYAWLLCRLVFGRGWSRVVAFRRPGAGQLLVAWLLFLPGMMFTCEGLDTLLRWLTGLRNDTYSLMLGAEAVSPFWLSVLAIGVGPGVVEELFCRGFLGRGLVGRHGWVLGVSLTSLLFGLLHLEPVHVVITLLIGVGLHFTLAASRSLWVPVLLHATNNTLSVLQWRLIEYFATPSDPLVVALRYGSAVLLLGLGVWALWASRAKVVPAGDNQEGWRPKFPTAAAPPPDSGLITAEGRLNPLPVLLAVLPLAGLVASFVLNR